MKSNPGIPFIWITLSIKVRVLISILLKYDHANNLRAEFFYLNIMNTQNYADFTQYFQICTHKLERLCFFFSKFIFFFAIFNLLRYYLSFSLNFLRNIVKNEVLTA